jgi:RNA polymerase sigma-70 factor (ECF subfamily)
MPSLSNSLSSAQSTEGLGAFFAELFAEHLSWAWSLVRRLGVPERDAQDVTHDAFVAVHRNLAAFDRARPARPWLYSFLVHAAMAHKRRAHVRRERFEESGLAEQEAPSSSPEASLGKKQAIARAMALLEKLPDERRVVLVLADLEGVPVPEVATCLDIPLNTAYSRLRLAREELAEHGRRLRAGEPR